MAWSSSDRASRMEPAAARARISSASRLGGDAFLRAHPGEVAHDLVE